MSIRDQDLPHEKSAADWDRIFDGMRAEEIVLGSSLARKMAQIFHAHLKAGSSLLEAGSGSGELSGYLAKIGYDSHLLDRSTGALRLSRKFFHLHRLAGAFYRADIRGLPFSDGALDCVWNSGVLEHFSDREITELLREMARVSRSLVIVAVPNASSVFYQLRKWWMEREGTWAYGDEFPRTTLLTLMMDAGLEVIEERHISADLAYYQFSSLPGCSPELSGLVKEWIESAVEDEPWLMQGVGYLTVTVAKKVPQHTARATAQHALMDASQLRILQALRLEAAERNEALRKLEERLAQQEEAVRALQQQLSDRDEARMSLQHHLEETITRALDIEAQFKAQAQYRDAQIASLTAELQRSKAWSIFPLLALAERARNKAVRVLRAFLRKYLPRPLTSLYRELRRPGLPHEDNSQVTVYYDTISRFPDHPQQASLSGRLAAARRPVSLVVTVRNEGHSARAWSETLLKQTRQPDEVIIVDGGSTDDTISVLREFAETAPFPTSVIAAGDVNIARGRNIGIAQASHPIIACTDFGCDLHPRWLEYLTAPFEIDEDTMVVAGWHEAKARKALGKAAAILGTPHFRWVDPQSFLPSSRSLALKKEAWIAIGGYPEWLTLTGEDTYFALELKRCCPRWALVPDAKVYWRAPDTLMGSLSKAYRWSFGDGEAGLFPDRYWGFLRKGLIDLSLLAVGGVGMGFSFLVPWLLAIPALAALALAWRLAAAARARLRLAKDSLAVGAPLAMLSAAVSPAIRWASVFGFVAGVRNRPQLLERRLGGAEGVALVLSLVPISDSGGGQRPAQLALEFLHRGYLVVFLNKWESYATVDLGTTITAPRLLTYPVDSFDFPEFLRKHDAFLRGKPFLAVLEAPVREFLPIAKAAQAAGGTVVYDLIDDWATSLGRGFYFPEVEQAIIDTSHVLMATATVLKEHLERASGRPAALIPNAVNTQIFKRDNNYPRPADLAAGEFVICYIGALWGEWFDWNLLRRVALAYPSAAVVVIGDYRGQCPDPPPNLHFLGLKPQRQLPAYLTHCDVAIIPWTVSKITEATSPLKLYEYLAMGKPAVATRIRELEGIPYVLLSKDDADFIANIEKARRLDVDPAVSEAFIHENSWSQRVSLLLDVVENWRQENGSHQSRIRS